MKDYTHVKEEKQGLAVIFFISAVLSLLFFPEDSPACTVGTASGLATVDGRPIMWKVRDASGRQQLIYVSGSPYNYLGVCNIGGSVYLGLNEAGVGTGNATVAGGANSAPQTYILENCSSMLQIRNYLLTVTDAGGNFPFIDGEGNASVFEIDHSSWFAEYDAVNPNRQAQGLFGFVVRANEYHYQSDGTDNTGIGGRYYSGTYNIHGLVDSNNFSVKTIIQGDSGPNAGFEYIRYGPGRTFDTIANYGTVSAIIVHGIAPGEDPALATMWTILGQTNYSIAVPTWVMVSDIPSRLNNGDMYDRAESLFSTGNEAATQASTFPAEAHMIDTVTNELLPFWRAEGAPSIDEMTRIEHQMANDAYSLLDCLDNVQYDNNAPTVSISTDTDVLDVDFTMDANDSDGSIVSTEWNFGDGNSSTDPSPSHTYPDEGDYLVSCTVTDDDGVSITAWKYLTIDYIDYDDLEVLSSNWLVTNYHQRQIGEVIGWWEFDDGDGNTAADSSGYGNTGTLYNEPNWQEGILEFDGVDDYVQTAYNANKLQLTGNYTWAVWLKADSTQADWATIFNKYDPNTAGPGNNHWSLQFGVDHIIDTSGKIVVWNGAGFMDFWDTQIELSEIAGGWHHIAVVRSQNIMTSYLDGDQVNWGTYTTNPISGEGHLNIGADRRLLSFYKGLIGDIIIYDYQLTSDEVRELSLEHPVGQLVGWWNFDDADANDNSGNGHHGTIMGSVTIVEDANIIGAGNKVAKFPGDTSSFIDCGGGGGGGTWADFAGDTMTIAAWFRTDGAFYTSYQYVCAKENMWRVSRYSSSENIRFFNTGLAGGSTGNLIGTIKADDGQWHHVVGVYDGSNRYLYFDGELDVFDSRTGNLAETTWDVIIGGNGGSPERTWRGWIDDVRLYDYALSPSAVEWLNEGAPASEPVNYLCFERPIGDINGDCKVDFGDFEMLASNWLESNL